MGFVFWLYVITLLLMPFLALIVSSYLTWQTFKPLLIIGLPIFLVYDILLIAGYSLKGDYPDYCMWSIQYFFGFVAITTYRNLAKNLLTKILRLMIYTIWIGGIVKGVPDIILFITLDMDYISDEKFPFKSDDKSYETRRFSFGFVSLENIRYTFNTYREFEYTPFEEKIDHSVVFDDNKGFDGVGEPLQMSIEKVNGRETLIFKAPGKGRYAKLLN